VDQTELRLSEQDLRHWKLLEKFREALEPLCSPPNPSEGWEHPERKLRYGQYLSLFLFGLFNPAIRTMRALCSASQLKRVQQEVCGGTVSLGSFSEAQHLVDVRTLERVFGDLSAQLQGPLATDPREGWRQWFARDSSLFAALPRMAWALYGGGRAGAANRAVRLNLNLHLLADTPAQAHITPGRYCERKSWEEQWEAKAAYVGDRYFTKNYQVFGRLEQKGCAYVLRLIEEATVTIEQELALTEADRRANVVRQAWVRLGKEKFGSVRVRLIWIESQDCALMLVTNLPPELLSAEWVSLLYRRRWQIECFFRWVKCLLGCRHWLAESQNGVTIQLYLALIAAVLLQLCLGRRPNKRMFELLQLHQMGWASTEELIAALQKEQQRELQRKKLGR
jgi:hypothetical protein